MWSVADRPIYRGLSGNLGNKLHERACDEGRSGFPCEGEKEG